MYVFIMRLHGQFTANSHKQNIISHTKGKAFSFFNIQKGILFFLKISVNLIKHGTLHVLLIQRYNQSDSICNFHEWKGMKISTKLGGKPRKNSSISLFTQQHCHHPHHKEFIDFFNVICSLFFFPFSLLNNNSI